jgi:hypothetical protein
MGKIIPYIVENKNMFETTKQLIIYGHAEYQKHCPVENVGWGIIGQRKWDI